MDRNTPTRVGKTAHPDAHHRRHRKHPHARGEDTSIVLAASFHRETPPRAWGRPRAASPQPHLERNTPTRVGKTLFRPYTFVHNKKPPHARGEDSSWYALDAKRRETPPRAWGRRQTDQFLYHLMRNTPTRVGKTKSSPRASKPQEKHPHARGEDGLAWGAFLMLEETPPRAWGRLQQRLPHGFIMGNTPTRVGKTQRGRLTVPYLKKPPHARGEDFDLSHRAGLGTETPPRAWGRPWSRP